MDVPSFLDFPLKCKLFTNTVINFDRIRAFIIEENGGASGPLEKSRVNSDESRLNPAVQRHARKNRSDMNTINSKSQPSHNPTALQGSQASINN